MAVYAITRYPRAAELRDACRVTLRPMVATDVDALLAMFLRVPEEERFFLKEDVTSPEVVSSWATDLDYDRALPLLATTDGRIVADAVLIRKRGNARSHVGEIRIVVDPESRGRGLGTILMRELAEIAHDAELELLLFEMVKDVQNEAIQAALSLGAFQAGAVEGIAKGLDGRVHDLVFLKLPLGRWWEWSQF